MRLRASAGCGRRGVPKGRDPGNARPPPRPAPGWLRGSAAVPLLERCARSAWRRRARPRPTREPRLYPAPNAHESPQTYRRKPTDPGSSANGYRWHLRDGRRRQPRQDGCQTFGVPPSSSSRLRPLFEAKTRKRHCLRVCGLGCRRFKLRTKPHAVRHVIATLRGAWRQRRGMQ